MVRMCYIFECGLVLFEVPEVRQSSKLVRATKMVVSFVALKKLLGALQCLGWQPDKGALPRMGRDARPDAFAPMPALVLIACMKHPFYAAVVRLARRASTDLRAAWV